MTFCKGSRSIYFLTIIMVLLHPKALSAASFNCSGVISADEKTICSDHQLSEKDVEMQTTYRLLRKLMLMGGRNALQDEQSSWLTNRQKCKTNKECLLHMYNERLRELNNHFEIIASALNN